MNNQCTQYPQWGLVTDEILGKSKDQNNASALVNENYQLFLLVVTNTSCQSKMLKIRKTWRGYTGTLYYFCNNSLNLKLFYSKNTFKNVKIHALMSLLRLPICTEYDYY